MTREIVMTAVVLMSFLLWILLVVVRRREYAANGKTKKLDRYISYTFGVVSCWITATLILMGISTYVNIAIMLVIIWTTHLLFHKKYPWMI